LPAKNVFAKIGLNLRTIHETEIDDVTIFDKVQDMKPLRIYIMLGSNQLGYMKNSTIASDMDIFLDALADAAPDSEIFILSITGITAAREQTKIENMKDINEYNGLLKQLTAEKGCGFLDVCGALLDSTGYLAAQYVEPDGLHLKSGAFKVMLNFIQNQLVQ
jgi:hypothetical protein